MRTAPAAGAARVCSEPDARTCDATRAIRARLHCRGAITIGELRTGAGGLASEDFGSEQRERGEG